MARRKKTADNSAQQVLRPTLTQEAREARLVSLAMDLAEQQLLDGTVSSQVLTELLRRGSDKARAELAHLEAQNQLVYAKIDAIQAANELKEVYENAIAAMMRYSGRQDEVPDLDDDYEDYGDFEED